MVFTREMPPIRPTVLALVDELFPDRPVFLDEVQEVEGWQRLVRTLVDRRRAVCVTGSNASILGRELGTKLTGRHDSHEVFPFSYRLFCAYTKGQPDAVSLREYLEIGGFPGFLRDPRDQVLQRTFAGTWCGRRGRPGVAVAVRAVNQRQSVMTLDDRPSNRELCLESGGLEQVDSTVIQAYVRTIG